MFLPFAVLLFACPLFVATTHPDLSKRCNEYKPGEGERRKNTVLMVCSRGFAYHSACLTRKGTRFPVGDTLVEDGIEYKCISDDGINARLEEKEIKTVPLRAKRDVAPVDLLCEGKYKNGERFNFGSYIKECQSTPTSWNIVVVACLTPQKRKIAAGDNAFEEGFEYSCIKVGNFAILSALEIPFDILDKDS